MPINLKSSTFVHQFKAMNHAPRLLLFLAFLLLGGALVPAQVLFYANMGQVRDAEGKPRPEIRYVAQFQGMDLFIREKGFSVKHSYEALLTCRHKFSHEGSIPETASYADVKRGFDAGKVVMECLAKTLERA